MLSVEEALVHVLRAVPRIGTERASLDAARGRVLREPVFAAGPLPPWDSSAMDGFAVRAADLDEAGRQPVDLPIAGTVAAGHPAAGPLLPGTTVRITTGAPVPAGADSVVMKEDVVVSGDRARFTAPVEPGRHVRRAGEDVAPDAVVLEAGIDLGAGEIGLLAAVGRSGAQVARRPRVAILATGDELCEPGEPAGPGQIVGSNGVALAAQVAEAGGEASLLGISRDDRRDIEDKLREGLRADMLLTCGGVSVGEYDLVRDAFGAVGVQLDFWQVAMRPGRPLVFGRAPSGNPVFGLPGNPVSAMVSFELFVRPALRTMLGAASGIERPRVEVALGAEVPQAPLRHFVRARVERRGALLVAQPLARQGSHELRSMVDVGALLEVPARPAGVSQGRLPAGAIASARLLKLV